MPSFSSACTFAISLLSYWRALVPSFDNIITSDGQIGHRSASFLRRRETQESVVRRGPPALSIFTAADLKERILRMIVLIKGATFDCTYKHPSASLCFASPLTQRDVQAKDSRTSDKACRLFFLTLRSLQVSVLPWYAAQSSQAREYQKSSNAPSWLEALRV